MSFVHVGIKRFWMLALSTGLLSVGVCERSEALELGVFSGGGSYTQLAANFEAWLGRASDFNVDFFAYQAYTGPNNLADMGGWDAHVWNLANHPNRNMLFSVPLATIQDASLLNVALGKYDTQFLQAAQNVAKYYPKAIIRLGWEFNANWYPWSAAGRPQDYIAAFRRVAQLFKSVSPAFRIDWCPNIGSNSMAAELAYPGDDVVDVIGLDVYNDWRYSVGNTPVQRWNYIVSESHGLSWHKQFASLHGKPMSFPEWAVNHDDPYFIQQMYNWIAGSNFAYAAYWDSNSGFAGQLDSNQYPGTSSTYQALFKAIPVAK